MHDWANALCAALDATEASLASACHLAPGMTGEGFEQALGLLLRWQQVQWLEERFQDLGGPHAGSHTNHVVESRQKMTSRLNQIMQTVNQTLYDQFGQDRVDDHRAAQAYGALLQPFDTSDLVVATTNYDRAGEAGLEELGLKPDTGFRNAPGRTPRLNVRGLVNSRAAGVTPYLHLHGSVGWYEREGIVHDHAADQPFNSTLGTPVVLYPDPNKDPTNDAIVSDLWVEFRSALDGADHVLVVGHSLHDPALTMAIQTAKPQKLAVTYFDDSEVEQINKVLPSAIPVRLDFGPELDGDMATIAAFRD